MKLRDRLRSFREATQRSGFGRYAQAERASNEEIDRRNKLAAEELYRKQATIRNASPDFSLVYRINQSLGIGRSRVVSQSDVLSAFPANPYRHRVEEAIRQSALARTAS